MNTDAGQRLSLTSMRSSKPIVTVEDIKDLLHRRYGIRAALVKEFESYDDRTFYVKTEPGHGIGESSEFIAKMMNSLFTADKGVVATLNDILNHLKSFPELGCQYALPNLAGDLLSYEMISNDVQDGDVYVGRQEALSALRLFNFVPGKPLTCNSISPLPASFFFDVGKHLGKLQQALQEYPGDTTPLKLKAKSIWCLSSVPWLREYLPLVSGTQERQMLQDVIEQFEAEVVPVIGDLPKGLVQHDFNGDNVLVTAIQENVSLSTSPKNDCSHTDAPKSNGVTLYRISGIIDFDDSFCTCLVYEVAIAMMYMMYCSDQPIEATAFLLAGFETVCPLLPEERGILKILVAGRFAQSLLISLMQTKKHPDNTYVASTLVKGWSLLRNWWGQTKSHLQELWDSIRARSVGDH